VADYNKALESGCPEAICSVYDSRLNAYWKLHDYQHALRDSGLYIHTLIANGVFLMNIDQFRKMYPEFDRVPDKLLTEKLRGTFYPKMSYEDFANHFLKEKGGDHK